MGDGTAPRAGTVERLSPGLRVLTAPNPSPMTFAGTRSYLVGKGEVALIDPGPEDARHLAALEAELAGERLAVILVTHAHRDHSAGARAVQGRLGGEVLSWGDPAAARSLAMAALAAAGGIGGGEGIDRGFAPDRRLDEGETVAGPGWTLTALHTPGHLGDHLCFDWAEGQAIFTGDTVMGWSSTLISPPDGNLGAFLASLRRLQACDARVFYPGHGPPVGDPQALLAQQLAHRAAREAQILSALRADPADAAALVAEIYVGLDPALRPAAARNVLAHLIDLVERGVVRPEGDLSAGARFALI